MGELRDIPFENQPEEIKETVQAYWTKRADGFFRLRQDEIESRKAALWLNEITKKLPQDRPLNILDVGCGAGFFEVLLGRAGHYVTGIDLTPEMIQRAGEMIRACHLDDEKVSVFTADAEHPDFPDETFDAIVTRNLTWTLPHPVTAYRAWHRILKKGGTLLNFDAEYARNAHNLYDKDNIAHANVSNDLKEECHRIYHMLTISNLRRPAWDEAVLKEIGFSAIDVDPDFSSRVFAENDEFYIPDRMFAITAVK